MSRNRMSGPKTGPSTAMNNNRASTVISGTASISKRHATMVINPFTIAPSLIRMSLNPFMRSHITKAYAEYRIGPILHTHIIFTFHTYILQEPCQTARPVEKVSIRYTPRISGDASFHCNPRVSEGYIDSQTLCRR